MSNFLAEVHTELHNLWKSLDDKTTGFASLFKGVIDKVGTQVEAEAKAAAPVIEKDAETVAADVEKAAEAAAPAVEEAAKEVAADAGKAL